MNCYLYSGSSKSETYKFTMHAFSMLVNSNCLDSFVKRLVLIYTAFGSEYINSLVKMAIQEIEEIMRNICCQDQESFTEPEDEKEDLGFTQDNKEDSALNPFLAYISQYIANHYTCQNSTMPQNKIYNPQWLQVLEKKWLPHIPFWTSLFRGIPITVTQ